MTAVEQRDVAPRGEERRASEPRCVWCGDRTDLPDSTHHFLCCLDSYNPCALCRVGMPERPGPEWGERP